MFRFATCTKHSADTCPSKQSLVGISESRKVMGRQMRQYKYFMNRSYRVAHQAQFDFNGTKYFMNRRYFLDISQKIFLNSVVHKFPKCA